MKKTTVAFVALILIMTGCSVHPGKYPKVDGAVPPVVQPVTIGITIPNGADDATEIATVTLQAKLGELSGGAIKTEVYRSRDVMYELNQSDVGLYLLDDAQVVAMDSRLEFIQMPFLFDTADQLLAILNSQDGAVRGSSITQQRLGGEVLGVYYGGANCFLGRGRFYDEVGFYKSVGVQAGLSGNACFSLLGAELVIEGSSEELFTLLEQDKIKYCEIQIDDEIPDTTMDKVKSLETINHRFATKWMILSDKGETLDPTVKSIIREAFSYTVMQHNTTRMELDVARISRLEERVNLLVHENADYSITHHTGRKYYRTNWEALSIPKDIWAEIQLVKGY